MRDSGMIPLPCVERHDDPFFAHFPVLKTMLSTAIGRRAGELRRFSEDPRLFQNLAIYLTPPGPTGCGLTSFANGIGSI
jgi:hypothetical protein